ncbi:COG4223 family protein [Rhizorhabdus dicambivorans]|uniref:Inner membrane protein n=1 Tax=Rhizorhabdus dicambivorans TaxID=1850238 RepID=A0A2A4FPU4_9SPHN|nr:hypothetical protein [Rhizorhabdus dicambivorans]ATE63789.1 hypothetical protein CMV14_04785 [Rhizorhabdus dicambivorans]PCE40433.1 hypothetical protein COO09_20280 [Rhizorhabdus dicambivorans]
MPDPADTYGRPRRSVMPLLLGLLVALLLGMGAMAWLFHRFDEVAEVVKPTVPVVVPAATPPRRVPLIDIAPPPAADVVRTILDQRIDQIEQKVEDIDERTAAATTEAHRAERLLVAFAARRAIDRGAPLGYLEGALRERFGRLEPQAVAVVISAGRQPVTIAQLRDKLEVLRPKLAVAAENESWWAGVRRELAGLIVVRRADTPSTAPVDRLSRAEDALAAGHVDGALVEVARLPGRKAAEGWIADARRYVQSRAALDRIESAALLEPVQAGPEPAPAPAVSERN